MPAPTGWVYGFTNPGPFAIVRNPDTGPEGQWQKSGVDVPTSQNGQTTFNAFELTAAEAAKVGAPADDYLMIRYTDDPAVPQGQDIDDFPGLTQVFSIGQGQIVYPEAQNAIAKIMDTVGVADAESTLRQNVTAFNTAVAEYNTTHGTSHPPLDITGDVDWVDDTVEDLPITFGYKVAYFSASFGYPPGIFTRDYVAP